MLVELLMMRDANDDLHFVQIINKRSSGTSPNIATKLSRHIFGMFFDHFMKK